MGRSSIIIFLMVNDISTDSIQPYNTLYGYDMHITRPSVFIVSEWGVKEGDGLPYPQRTQSFNGLNIDTLKSATFQFCKINFFCNCILTLEGGEGKVS